MRLRHAMSLALDRDELNEVYLLALGRPTRGHHPLHRALLPARAAMAVGRA